ncbi:HD domain-containing protein [Candidatus Poribacteria bacterium]|nr:HD domain-containing protein [Candidatus Poribacteria bacterium]
MKTSVKFLILAGCFVVISAVHYTTQTEDPGVRFVHVIFQDLYLVPIVFSAYWFGLIGGLLSATLAIVFYLPHVSFQWLGGPMDKADQLGAMAVFALVGLAAGFLSSMEKRARLQTERVEARSQRRAVATAITALERALKAKDEYTRAHSERVADVAVALARRIGLDEADCEEVWLAALMHDVGKIGVRDDVLLKPDSLTGEEWETIKKHPNIAEEILKPIKGIGGVVSIVRSHHENFDGTGYPQGLKRDEIPLGAQVLAVADTFSALTDDRAYHKHEEAAKALDTMETMSGKKLNPEILEVFKRMILEQSGGNYPASKR